MFEIMRNPDSQIFEFIFIILKGNELGKICSAAGFIGISSLFCEFIL